MSASAPLLVENQLIAKLEDGERQRLLAECDPVDMIFGEILCEAGQSIEHVYFPLSGFISMVVTLNPHGPLEMGLVGNEGMLGATLTLGIDDAPMRAVVQGSGSALRIDRPGFQRAFGPGSALRCVLDRYLYVLMTQLTQNAACTVFHEIEPRLARWLLMTHDRAHSNQFFLTHEYLGNMLGVRRSGISIAAEALKAKHLIEYSRGEISVLDRKGLEHASCECYGAMVDDYASMFHG